jgi:hypothetical protein
MPTYPLTFPAVKVQTSSFRLVRAVASQASPFTGQEQVYRNQGEWWEGEINFIPSTRVNARLVQAFLAELRGKFGTFLYGDPDAIALGRMGVGGTVTVNGAGQTGNTLTVDGMTLSTNNILMAGDYFQLGTGTSARLYMATQPLNSNGSGQGTITFEPALRASPADNSAVTVTNPLGLFRLSENTAQWDADQSNVYSISLAFREAL